MPLDISSGTSSTPVSCPPTHQQHPGEFKFMSLYKVYIRKKKKLKFMNATITVVDPIFNQSRTVKNYEAKYFPN